LLDATEPEAGNCNISSLTSSGRAGIQEGVKAVDWLGIVQIFATLLAAFGLMLFMRHLLPSYVAEKGKNLATKEDIGAITREIESVKATYAENIEALRAALSSRSHIHQVRYEQEFAFLLELTEKVVELRNAAMSLRPTVSFGKEEGTEEEVKKRRLARYSEARHAIHVFSDTRQPFLPAKIYAALDELGQVAWNEAVAYSMHSPNESDYWEGVLENQRAILERSNNLLQEIRRRVQEWEEFDLGPDSARHGK
jgi:hypothetical protein